MDKIVSIFYASSGFHRLDQDLTASMKRGPHGWLGLFQLHLNAASLLVAASEDPMLKTRPIIIGTLESCAFYTYGGR